MKPEVQMIIGVATLFIGGVGPAIVTYFLNKRKETRATKRQKLEQLCIAGRKYVGSLASHYASYLVAMEKTVPGEAFQSDLVTGGADVESLENARMLQSLYFPEFSDYFAEVERTRSRAQVQIDILCDKEPPSKRHLEGCLRCLTADHESIEQLAHELVTRVRAIAARLA